MNGRLYAPVLHRFLQPDNYVQDPFNTQNFNRYGYVLNNPLLYTDPSGELAWFVPVIFAGVQLIGDLIRNEGKMNFGQIMLSLGQGALSGVLAGTGAGAITNAWTALVSAALSQVNIPIYSGNNFSFSISPSLYAGSNGVRLGVNLSAIGRLGNINVGVGYSLGRNFSATDLSGTMKEAAWSSIRSWQIGWSDGDYGLSYGRNTYGGNYAQTIGNVGFQIGKFSMSIENDFLVGKSEDMYRTAALTMNYQISDDFSLSAGFSIWTGIPNESGMYTHKGRDRSCYYSEKETPYSIRNGNLFFGGSYGGKTYLAGRNSENIRAFIQNGWHSAMGTKALKWFFGGASPHFEKMPYSSRFYGSYGTYFPFSSYRQ